MVGKPGSASLKESVHNVLEQFEGLPLRRSSATSLKHNVLLACYRAKFAVDPGEDSSAKERKKLLESFAALKGQADAVSLVLTYLERHVGMAEKAMSCGLEKGGWLTSRTGSRNLAQLRKLLKQYREGLKVVQDFDHPTHISFDDFIYGPFEFDFSIYNWSYKGADIRQSGLMFNLAYLFRYYTCAELPDPIDSRFREGEELEFYGRMLQCGHPHTELIAPLVNAIFEPKVSARQVQDRLRDLSRKSKGARFPKRAKFIGWSLP